MTGNPHLTRKHRVAIGTAFWLFAAIGIGVWLIRDQTAADNRTDSPARLLLQSLTSRTAVVVIDDPSKRVDMGDVVFARTDTSANVGDSDTPWQEVGYVSKVRLNSSRSESNELTVTLFDPELAEANHRYLVHRSSGRLDEVLATLLPGERREALQAKLQEAMKQHADEVTSTVLPLVLESLRASVPVIEQELAASIERHQPEIELLAQRYRDEIVQERLIPLVRQEVIPIIRRHGQEPAEEIGREIWNKASLWRFGWRALYDKSPLPERELVQEEWRRFLEQEIVPTVEDHLDELAIAVEEILRDLASNELLRNGFGEVILTIADDEEARNLFRVIVKEAVFDNESLREVWTNIWTSEDARRRLRIAGQRIEPILRQIGDEVMGTREDGIEPGFAKVLRNQILGKDRTWITIHPVDGLSSTKERPRLMVAREFMAYPVVHLANQNN
jgi:hypothetical protein